MESKELEMEREMQKQMEKALTAGSLESVGTVSVEAEEFAGGAQVRVMALVSGYPCVWYANGCLYSATVPEVKDVEKMLSAVLERLAALGFTNSEGPRRMYVEGVRDDIGFLAERVHRVYRVKTEGVAA